MPSLRPATPNRRIWNGPCRVCPSGCRERPLQRLRLRAESDGNVFSVPRRAPHSGGIVEMTDQWLFKSETYDNCNCAVNCGCQFNLPSTHGYCQSAFVGTVVEGHFNETPLAGLNWAGLYKWPGEIAEGNGKRQIIIDERADAA